MSTFEMKAKFPGKCSACGFKFPKDTQIKFDTNKRTAEHVTCPEQSYDGTKQAAIFDMWIERAESAMWADTSPHLSQPDEDLEG